LQEGKVDFIPNFIKAKLPEVLRQLMLSNNASNGIMFHYYDIQFVNGHWYAWYNVPVNPQEIFGLGGDND